MEITSSSREIEFKFAVEDKQVFERLVRQLNLPESVLHNNVTQTNHFFDSPTHCLHKQHLAIRLREEKGSHLLTIKGANLAKTGKNSVLTDRIEEQVALSHEDAHSLLQGIRSPREIVEQRFGDKATSLLQMIESACDAEQLVNLGMFSNVRIILPAFALTVAGSTETIEFELDTSTFPDGNIEHELEVEITPHSDAANIEQALVKLLHQAGIEWHSAPSKAERFYSALKSESVLQAELNKGPD